MPSSRYAVRTRFTLLYGAALIATVLLVSSSIYFFAERALMLQIENHLRKDLATVGELLRRDPDSLRLVAEHGPIHLFSVTAGGRSFISSHNWHSDGLDQALRGRLPSGVPETVRAGNGRLFRVHSATIDLKGGSYLISVGHHQSFVEESLSTLKLIILLILPLSAAISLALGYLIAGRVLAPVTAITKKAQEISAENLSERLPVLNPDDEFGRLATVFNQVFGRIEDSFAKLRRFTADASHELRTPLTAIRSIGETALQDPHAACSCQENIGSILEETDRLVQLVEALLQLSRADAGAASLQREPLDLAALAEEAVEFLSVLSEEKEQKLALVIEERPVVTVDRTSVRQALINLLDNAIKYTPAGKEIRITVKQLAHQAALVEIADSGPGIAEGDLERIFDRFYRVDTGRSREIGGAGLGLSIVRWAVEANGGRVEVESRPGMGSVFRVTFPGQRTQSISQEG